jgi:predicted nuclease of predicted toxin-antitoxin system
LKLLLDENLSDRLVGALTELFGECVHVRHAGLASATDDAVWRYARDNECAIVSKDSDFHQRVLIEGPPPKVIWVRRGNCTTTEILRVLRDAREPIEQFARDDELAFLILE